MEDKAYLVNPILNMSTVVLLIETEDANHAILVVHALLFVNKTLVVKVTCQANAEEATVQGNLRVADVHACSEVVGRLGAVFFFRVHVRQFLFHVFAA